MNEAHMGQLSGEEKAREQWKLIRQTLGSRMKTLEIMGVIEGIKPAARILCREEDLPKTQALLHPFNLSTAVSDFKLILEPATASAFVEKAVTAPLHPLHNDKQGHLVIYASKDSSLAERAKQCEEKQDHQGLGKLLGYPPCCCEFFNSHFSERRTDLTLDALEASSGWEFPFLMNIAARHVDASVLSHFPCSFSCEKSLETARKLFQIIKKCGQEDVFYLCLQTAVVYSEKEGAVFLQHPVKIGNAISYSNSTATSKGKLGYLLGERHRITIVDKHSFMAGDDAVQGKDIGVMLFS